MDTENRFDSPNPGLDAAREGRSFCGYVNAKTGIDTEAVLTDATFLKKLEAGKRFVMTQFYMYLSTASDWVTVQWVQTENEDGTGEVTVLSPKLRIDTGAALAQTSPTMVHVNPPVVVSNEDGRAFSARVQGNDAAAALTLSFHGWEEADEVVA